MCEDKNNRHLRYGRAGNGSLIQLCGTKVLRRSDYVRLKDARNYFGNFDPFGDFDLIFGASGLGLKITEVPIRYANRTYGETQISRFRHGLLLLRMVWFAFLRIKAL